MTERLPFRVFTALVGLVFLMPLVYVGRRGFQHSSVELLSDASEPLFNTLVLSTSVALTAAVLGTGLAWLVVRTDLPGYSTFRWLLIMPLALPSFVGATGFVAAFGKSGLIETTFGIEGTLLRGFWPAWFVLSLFTFPYVYLPVMARAKASRLSLEQSARLLGKSGLQTFVQISLRQLAPAITGGALLVFLYSLSEYGAVQIFRYKTLSRVIFSSFIGDKGKSFTGALLLVLLAIVVVIAERKFRSSTNADQRSERTTYNTISLGKWKFPCLTLCLAIITLSVALPVVSLGAWAARGVSNSKIDYGELAALFASTAAIGVVTALVTVAVVFPVALQSIRRPSISSHFASVGVFLGFAIPGVVLALASVFWVQRAPNFLTGLYQSFPMLVGVYVLHFGAQALGSNENAVRAVPDTIRESARLLEPSVLKRAFRVQLPLMRPGLTSGIGLALLSTIKELPITLLVSPIGFKTLSTQIWGSYEEADFATAGAASLLLLSTSALLTAALLHDREHLV